MFCRLAGFSRLIAVNFQGTTLRAPIWWLSEADLNILFLASCKMLTPVVEWTGSNHISSQVQIWLLLGATTTQHTLRYLRQFRAAGLGGGQLCFAALLPYINPRKKRFFSMYRQWGVILAERRVMSRPPSVPAASHKRVPICISADSRWACFLGYHHGTSQQIAFVLFGHLRSVDLKIWTVAAVWTNHDPDSLTHTQTDTQQLCDRYAVPQLVNPKNP